jgi:hypothetical protein
MMLRWLLVSIGLLLLPALSQAQCPGMTAQQTPFATETLTVSTTAKAFTAAVYKPTASVTVTMAMVSVEGGAIRYQVVGTPTATAGHPLSGTTGITFAICGVDSIAGFKAIRQTTDATLFVTYYKNR